MKRILILILTIFIISGCSTQKPTIQPPVNIKLEGDTLQFNEVSNAVFYELELNSVVIKLEVNSYKLETAGTYMVRVRSVDKDNNRSAFSSMFTFQYEIEDESGEDEESFDPYIIEGNDKLYIEGEDLVIIFAYNQGFYIKSITAPNNDIETTEYEIEGNEVVLKHSFLKRKFEEDRQSLILAFIVSNDEHQFLINVFIKEQNN